MEPMDCTPPPDEAQGEQAPPETLQQPAERMRWIDTLEGRNVAATFETARKHLHNEIYDGKVLKKKLEEAEQERGKLTSQLDSIKNDIRLQYAPDGNEVLTRRIQLAGRAARRFKRALNKHQSTEKVFLSQYRKLQMQMTCAQICDLPTELREMIYRGVLGSCYSGSRSNEDLFPVKFIVQVNGILPLSQCDYLFDHECFDISIYGAVVARDMAHASFFEVFLDPGYGNIPQFLADDRWGVGLRPIDFIHRLEVCIGERSLSPDDRNHPHMCSTLNALLLLKRGTEINIKLEIVQHDNPCFHCKQHYWEGEGHGCRIIESVYGRTSEDLAHFYQNVKPLCEALNQHVNSGLDVSLEIQDGESYRQYSNFGLRFSSVQNDIIWEREVWSRMHDKDIGLPSSRCSEKRLQPIAKIVGTRNLRNSKLTFSEQDEMNTTHATIRTDASNL